MLVKKHGNVAKLDLFITAWHRNHYFTLRRKMGAERVQIIFRILKMLQNCILYDQVELTADFFRWEITMNDFDPEFFTSSLSLWARLNSQNIWT